MIRSANLITGLVSLCLLAGLFWLSTRGTGMLTASGNHYTARFHSLQGISVGDPVYALGLARGHVAKIDLQDGQALATLRIAQEIPVREGSRLTLVNKTLLGGKRLELQLGPAVNPLLSDGAALPDSIESPSPARLGELSSPLFSLGDVGLKGGELISLVLKTKPQWPILGRIAQRIPETASNLGSLSTQLPRLQRIGSRLSTLDNHLAAFQAPEHLLTRWQELAQGLQEQSSLLDRTEQTAQKLAQLQDKFQLLEEKLSLTTSRKQRLLHNTSRLLAFLAQFDELALRKLIQEEGIHAYEPAFRKSTLPDNANGETKNEDVR